MDSSIRSAIRIASATAALFLLGLAQDSGSTWAGEFSCAGQKNCAENKSFVVTVSDFVTSVAGNDRLATATMRFQSKLNQPLILGYVKGSGVVTDNKGNRYVIGDNGVRGIGVVGGNNVDAKFSLEPGEASDARFEFAWRATKAELGTTFDMDITVEEIESGAGGQFKLGKERVLHFENVGGGASPAPAASGGAAAAMADPCAGLLRCSSGGPFIAQVASLTPVGSPSDRNHSLKLNLTFRNLSDQPIVLGYKSGSSAAIDNLGNGYRYGRPSTHDTSFSGIGLVTSQAADPSFALKPGETRNAAFTLIRYESRGKELGTAWSYDVVIDQLEILPSQQVRTGREYSLHFTDLTAAMPSIGAAGGSQPDLKKAMQDLKDLFKKKQ